jgi:hypothetical protein
MGKAHAGVLHSAGIIVEEAPYHRPLFARGLAGVKAIASAIRGSKRHAIDASNLPDWLRRDIGIR